MKSIRLQIGRFETKTVELNKKTIVISDEAGADVAPGFIGNKGSEWKLEWNGSEPFQPGRSTEADWVITYRAARGIKGEQRSLKLPLRLGGLELYEAKNDYFDENHYQEVLAKNLQRHPKKSQISNEALSPIRFGVVDSDGLVEKIFFVELPPGATIKVAALRGFKFKKLNERDLRIVFPPSVHARNLRVFDRTKNEDTFISVKGDFFDLTSNNQCVIENNGEQIHVGLVNSVEEANESMVNPGFIIPFLIELSLIAFVFFGLDQFKVKGQHPPAIVSKPVPVQVKVVEVQKLIDEPRIVEPIPAPVVEPTPAPVPTPPQKVAQVNQERKHAEAPVNKFPGAPRKPLAKPANPLKEVTARYGSKVNRPSKNSGPSLNSMAKRGATNQVGLLNSLKKMSSEKVSVENVLNDGIVQDYSTATSGRKGSVLRGVVQSPSGELGEYTTASTGKSRLAEASTTLDRTGDFNRKSSSPIAVGGKRKLSSKEYTKIDASATFSQQVTGGLNSVQVERSMEDTKNKIKKCYEESLGGNPNIGGNMVYTWTVNSAGGVEGLKLVSSDIQFPRLDLCIQTEIQNTIFGKSKAASSSSVRYSFRLEKI